MSGLGDMSDRSGTKQEELFGLPDLDTSTMTAQANTGSGGSTTTSSTAGTGNAANQVSALDSPVGNAPVSSPFRANRTCNPCSADHPGTDYAVPVGTTVVATADGTVIRAYRSRTFGNTVIIDHGPAASGSGNVYTLYAHGDSLTVNQGQSVTLGQSILTSGNTGNSTGPHLHYEVIQTSSTPFQRSFFGNVNERFAPVDLKNLIP
jgi:murein DD-endopeptidase MepM/ murein hydrolase activator NlpD